MIATGVSPVTATASPPVVPIRDTGHARALHLCQYEACIRRGHGDDVARLVLAEPVGVRHDRGRRRQQLRTDIAGHRHLGERDQKSTIGHVMHRRRRAGDHPPHHVAIALFGGEIHRALFAAADVAQIDGLAEPALGVADQKDRFARRLERERGGLGEIIQQGDAAYRGVGKMPRPSFLLGDAFPEDREIECATRLPNAF